MSAHSHESAFPSRRSCRALRKTRARNEQKHVPSDRPVVLVVHRPSAEQGLGGSEDLLHHPELLVLQPQLGRRKAGVGSQDPLAVET